MGDSNAQLAAAEYLEKVRETMQQQKLLAKSQHKDVNKKKGKRTRRGKKARSQTVSRVSGLEVLSRQQGRQSKNKMGTFSSASSKPWYQTPSEGSEESFTFSSSLVLENPMTQPEEHFPGPATQTDTIYRNPGVSQRLFEHEVSMSRANPEDMHSLYSLGQIVGNPCSRTHMPLPELPSDDSDTDYESVAGEEQSPGHTIGNKTHREELKKMSIMLVEPSPDMNLDGVDREWEQWLNIRANGDDE